jgi:glycosyltransferase involved in cell wall biosynthesis
LAIVGNGTLRPLVEQAVAADSKIVYAGRQPTATVVQWMRASDALVLPSLFEPWGLVVNEAMCCGLPVIATERVGAVDVVFDGLNGIIVPAEDVPALTAAIEKLAANPRSAPKHGAGFPRRHSALDDRARDGSDPPLDRGARVLKVITLQSLGPLHPTRLVL